MICWSCEREGGRGPACAACGVVLPPDGAAGYFEVLGLAPRFDLDLAAGEASYKRLSRQVHPDRFATADPRARKASLARTVQLNDAWRTLRDPVRRAEYLLERAGIVLGGDDTRRAGGEPEQQAVRKVVASPAFLMDVLELHEELKGAQRRGDAVTVAALSATMQARADAAMRTIGAALDGDAADRTPAQLDQAAQALAELRYYRRFLNEISAGAESGAEAGRAG
jgi:molecular chaperone HscB